MLALMILLILYTHFKNKESYLITKTTKMKSNLKYFALAIATLVIGLSSCSKNDPTPGGKEEGTKSVFIKISNAPSTRAEVTAQGSASVTFTTGNLFFTDASGNIIKHFSIGASKDIEMAAIVGIGKLVEGLPNSVTQVYVVGNTTVPTTGNISVVKAQVLLVESQGTIGNVNLYGEATALTAPVAPATFYTAAITLAPTVARIELTDITASGLISGYKVSGIYVDNFYSEAAVNESVVVGNLLTPTTLDTDYPVADADVTTKYSLLRKSYVYDPYTTAITADAKLAKPSTGVWGYNVFATKSGSVVPRIIIRLSNVTASGGITYDVDQFITVRGFNSGSLLEAIKSGHVYNIATGALVFDESNLSPTPNTELLDVKVTITLASWVPVAVTPIL